MDELHNVDLRGKNNEDWKKIHKDYIDSWDRRMEFLPIREPFLSLDMTSYLEYMSQFRVTRKLYLLSVDTRSRQLHQKRQQRPPQYIFWGTNVSRILHPNVDFDYVTYVEPDVAACTFNDDDTDTTNDPIVNASFNAWVNVIGEPSSTGVEDTRWEARTASHLSMEEVNRDQGEDEDEHDDEGEYEDEHKDDDYEGRGEDEHNEVDGDDSVHKPPVPIWRQLECCAGHWWPHTLIWDNWEFRAPYTIGTTEMCKCTQSQQ
ncbi:hypothetical protein Golob_026354, partial [Gossypium lobatum]|nr:hypothetical protein [Gossypium lobatum]